MNLIRLIIALTLLIGMQVKAVQADPDTPQNNTSIYMPIIMKQPPTGWSGPDGGSILGLVVDPGDENIVYAGSFGAGVFKSVDGGQSWTPSSNGLNNPKIQSLAIDPQHANILYAGTYRDETGGGKEGVFKSTDSGTTWFESSTGIQESAIVYSIAVNPSNPNQIFIATRGQSNAGINPWNGKIYRSNNAGGDWVELTGMSGVGGASQKDWAYAIMVHPAYPNQVFAATHEHGPWYSLNSGDSWSSSTTGISPLDLNGRSIVVDPASGATPTVYFGVWKATPGVYRSVNGGITWTQINTGLGGTTVYGLTINPAAPSELFVSSFKNGVFKTTNYGNNWSQAGLALNKTWITTQAPSNVQTTYTGTFGDGVYRSPDGGGTWVHTEAGIRNAWITGVVSVLGSAGQVFVSLNGGGVKHSADGGQTWEEFNEGLLDRYINGLAIDPAGTTLFALTDTHGLVRRTLSGGSWAGSTPALPKTIQEEPLYPEGHPLAGADTAEGLPGSPADGLAPGGGAPATVPLIDMEISTSNPNIMYLGTQYSSGCSICGVYQSTDGGSNWNYKGLAGQTIYSLAINPANPLEVYAATSAAGSVKTSTNGGNNWSDMSLAGRSFYALAVSPASPGMLFAATDSGVYLWNGLAWSSIGLSGVAVSSLAAHPHIPGNLSAGTASGAYNSVNGGASWQAGPAALEGLVIQSMHFEPAAGVVFYGTTTRGMYRGMIPN